MRRSSPLVPRALVHRVRSTSALALLASRALGPQVPLARALIRRTDRALGRAAGRYAARRGSRLLAYSYYAYDAFETYGDGPLAALFQLHPHPATVRRILESELRRRPEADSIRREWEIGLPPSDFGRLVEETAAADRWIVASTFSKNSLVEHGADPARIHVVPYGVDLDPSSPPRPPARSGPLQILFAGSATQRKGIFDLIDAISAFGPDEVRLTVCGPLVEPPSIFDAVRDRVEVHGYVDNATLRSFFARADLLALPSLAEGFGAVLLEGMAAGVPILASTATAGPDLIRDGEGGFLVQPGEPKSLETAIRRALDAPEEWPKMRQRARATAERFTWESFRAGLRAALEDPS